MNYLFLKPNPYFAQHSCLPLSELQQCWKYFKMNGGKETEEVAKVFLHSRAAFAAMPVKFCCESQVPWNSYSKMNFEKASSPVLDHTMCLKDTFLWVKLTCSFCLAHRQTWYRQPLVSASSLIAHTVSLYTATDKCANTVCLDIQSVIWYVPAKHLCAHKRDAC